MSSGNARQFGPIEIQGRALRCHVCSHDLFWEHELHFATPLTSLLDVEEWKRVAQCAVCERCGYVHMFIEPGTFGKKIAGDAPAPALAPDPDPA